jgi:hypothetical protein
MDGSQDAVLGSAAKAAVDSILACEVTDSRQSIICSVFRSILSFRSVLITFSRVTIKSTRF